MIQRSDILSMEYLKKTEFTGCHQGMRYRLESVTVEGEKRLKVTVWPEPFNFFTTPDEEKQSELFDFNEDGILDAIGWMNNCLFEGHDKFKKASDNWSNYQLR